ncbi:MAG: hypothetical protein ACRCX2_20040 [Paraclostridium sp.]
MNIINYNNKEYMLTNLGFIAELVERFGANIIKGFIEHAIDNAKDINATLLNPQDGSIYAYATTINSVIFIWEEK